MTPSARRYIGCTKADHHLFVWSGTGLAGCFARTKTADAVRPTPTDARFPGVHVVPKNTSPNIAVGTLLNEPAIEYVVAVVMDRNQSDENEIPKAITADAPAAAMKAGSDKATSSFRANISPLKQHKKNKTGTARTLLYRTIDISDMRWAIMDFAWRRRDWCYVSLECGEVCSHLTYTVDP
jgi:hypothetical protein